MRGLIRSYYEAFRGLSRDAWALALVTLLNRSGTMVLPYLALYVTQALHGTPTDAGWVVTCYGIGALAGALGGGRAADRFGPRSVQLTALMLATVGYLTLLACRTIGELATVTALVAAAAESFRPANAVAVAASATAADRRRTFALQRVAINLGMAIGPAIGGWLADRDFAWLFYGNAVASAIAAVVLAWLGPRTTVAQAADDPDPKARKDSGSPWQDVPFLVGLLVAFMVALLYFQAVSTLALHLTDHLHLSKTQIGWLFALNPVMIVLFEMLLVQTLRNSPPLPWIGLGVALVGVGQAAFALELGMWPVVLGYLIWTLGEMLESPMLFAYVATRASGRRQGAYMGLFTFVFALALIVAPQIGTWVYQQHGATVLWLSCGVVGLLGGGMALVLHWVLARSSRSTA